MANDTNVLWLNGKWYFIDMYDYVKVDQRWWDYLKKWYDYDYEIKVKNSNIEEIYKSLNTESNEY